MMEALVVHGAGGHGKVVAAAAVQLGWQVRQTDDKWGTRPDPEDQRIVAIGDNAARKKCASAQMRTVIHPSAYVDPSARLQPGVFVGPRAIIHVGAYIGRGAIINSGAIIEHDCDVGDWAHIAPGTVLCGTVKVGEGGFVGANSVVREGLTIAAWTVIGCGAVVVKSITEPGTYIGVPAKRGK